jgi:hypothetical protein
MHRAFVSALFALILGVGCSPSPTPAPLPSTYTCSDVAQNLATIESGTCADADGILYSKPNKKGEMYVDTCNNALSIHVPVPLTCLAKATTCAGAKACQP